MRGQARQRHLPNVLAKVSFEGPQTVVRFTKCLCSRPLEGGGRSRFRWAQSLCPGTTIAEALRTTGRSLVQVT
jgi:hypothetical protein